ncbi:unnamed protein product [Prunus brigantina]
MGIVFTLSSFVFTISFVPKHILLSFLVWLTVLGNLCYQFVFDGFILSGV